MKSTVTKYLESKEKSKYSDLDRILEMYVNGEIKTLLSKYAGVGIYPSFYKDSKTIQLNYNYNNIYVTIDFYEEKYSAVVYQAGIITDDLETLSNDYVYYDNFDLRILIEEIDGIIRNHPKLKDTSLIEKRRKVYSFIAGISLCLAIVINGSICLYCVITESVIKLNVWWSVCFIVIPLTVWFIFGVKSKRRK